MKTKILAFIGAMALAPIAVAETPADAQSSTAASTWQHDYLKSTNGTNVAFDFQVSVGPSEPATGAQGASSINPWLNLTKSTFTGHESAHAVVLVYEIFSKDAEAGQFEEASQVDTVQVDLRWDANAKKFTGSMPALPLWHYAGDGDDGVGMYFYEFAFVINNNWLTDPISGSHNFRYVPGVLFN